MTIYGKTVFPSRVIGRVFHSYVCKEMNVNLANVQNSDGALYISAISLMLAVFWSCTESKKRHQFVHHLWLFWPSDGLYPGAVFFFVMWNDPIMYTVKIQLYNKWGFQSTFCCCSFCISQVIFLFLTDARKVDIRVVYVGEVCTCSWTLNSSYVWLMKMISRIHTQHSSSQTKIA